MQVEAGLPFTQASPGRTPKPHVYDREYTLSHIRLPICSYHILEDIPYLRGFGVSGSEGAHLVNLMVQPSTLHPKTLKPKPSTLNPQP